MVRYSVYVTLAVGDTPKARKVTAYEYAGLSQHLLDMVYGWLKRTLTDGVLSTNCD